MSKSAIHLTPTQARVLFYRNIIVVSLSLIVGGKALAAIRASWKQSQVGKYVSCLLQIMIMIIFITCRLNGAVLYL